MSYRITCDGISIYDPITQGLVLESPKMQTAVNAADSATWTVWPNHPRLSYMKKLSSTFEIEEGGFTLFRGRLLSDKKTFYGAREMTLEGGLAFLHDSIIRPFTYPQDWVETGDEGYTTVSKTGNVVEFLLSWFLSQHNSQVPEIRQLKLGNVTVTDPNNYIPRSSESPKSTWDAVKDALYGSSLGGYMYCRYEDDGIYVDYVSEFPLTNGQTVKLADNLIDLTQEVDGSNVYTAILPQGKTLEDDQGTQTKERVGISKLSDGDVTSDIVKKGDYLYSKSGVAAYGMIFAPEDESKWDDVTDSEILESKAAAYLSTKSTMLQQTITVTAADLHFTAEEAEAFRPFRNVKVVSSYHDLDASYPVTAMTIPIDDPSSMTITLGDTRLSLTDANQAERESTGRTISNVDQRAIANGEAIRKIYTDMALNQTAMTQTATDIVLDALSEYVKTGDYDAFREEVENRFSVTTSGIEIMYRQLQESIQDVDGRQSDSVNEIRKCISFDQGDIVLSASNSGSSLRIKNDRISFMDSGAEVAWISNNNLHITDAYVAHSMRIGNFQFVPRDNGNLSFVWIGGDSNG